MAGRYLLAMHTVAVLALDRVIPFDLSTPIEVFTRTRLPDGRPGYQIRVCAQKAEIDAGAFTVRAPWGLDGLKGADTIIVPGTADPAAPLAPAVRDALREPPPTARASPPSARARSPWPPPASSTDCGPPPTGSPPPSWLPFIPASR